MRFMNQIVRSRRSVAELKAEIEEAMRDPEFRAIVRDFIRKTTS